MMKQQPRFGTLVLQPLPRAPRPRSPAPPHRSCRRLRLHPAAVPPVLQPHRPTLRRPRCPLQGYSYWFLGYDFDQPTPDHSDLSKARARFGPEVFESFFRRSIDLCRQAGLLEEGPMYVDSTLIQASAAVVTTGVEADEHPLAEVLWQHHRLSGLKLGEVVADAKYGTSFNFLYPGRLGLRGFIPITRFGVMRKDIWARALPVASVELQRSPARHPVLASGDFVGMWVQQRRYQHAGAIPAVDFASTG